MSNFHSNPFPESYPRDFLPISSDVEPNIILCIENNRYCIFNIALPTYSPQPNPERKFLEGSISQRFPKIQTLRTDSYHLMFEELVNHLKSYLEYPLNWDGYEGKFPSKATVTEAIMFLEQIKHARLPLPYAGLAADGEVNFFWKKNIFVDIGFLGDHCFSCYARDQQGQEYFFDDRPLALDIPCEIINVISQLEV